MNLPKFGQLQIAFLSVALALSLTGNIFLLLTNTPDIIATRVIDGDTFELGNGDRIRLLGVNAPESGRCMADESTEELKRLVLDKEVRITEEKRDTYGRRMGLVYVDKTLVNERMLRQGLARPDYAPNSYAETLKTAYRLAGDNAEGIHSSVCKKTTPTPPNPSCTIKGNIDKATGTHLYHVPSCRHYNQIVLDLDLGEQFFCSENDAKKAGFTLAPDCLR